MKNFLIILLCVNFLSLPALSMITDTFVESTLEPTLVIKKQIRHKEADSLVEENLDKNLVIKSFTASHFDDVLVNNLPAKSILPTNKTVNITDDFLPQISNTNSKKYHLKKHTISENNLKIVIRVKNELSTKQRPEEGDFVEFETVSDIKVNNKIYPKGTKVIGRVETVSMNTSMGVPADIVIGSFKMNNLSLAGEIKKIGANRSLWVYPAVYAGCMFFGAGILLAPIRGGHAQLKAEELYTLNY